MKNAAASHLDALFADKTRACAARRQAVSEHEGGQWPRRTSSRRVFNNPIFRREHPGISSAGRRREHEHAGRLLHPSFESRHSPKIGPRPINSLFVLDRDENSRITRAQKLWPDLKQVVRFYSQSLRAKLAVEGSAKVDRWSGQPNQRAFARLYAYGHWADLLLKSETLAVFGHDAFIE